MAIKIPQEVIASIENKKISVGGKTYRLKSMSKSPKTMDDVVKMPMDSSMFALPTPPPAPPVTEVRTVTEYIERPAPQVHLDPLIYMAPGPDGNLYLHIDPNATLVYNGNGNNGSSENKK